MDRSEEFQSKSGGCIILAILSIVIFFVIKSCFSTSPDKDSDSRKTLALVYSRRCVEQYLKAPASAEFSSNIEGVSAINDSIYIINSYVDAQNSFGAMIRTQYICKLTILSDDQYQCNEVILDE